jgi:ubiquinone/menaquinone biosynthesis C-methylase UbiE
MTTTSDDALIKRQKGEYWAREGAATVYERNVSLASPFAQIKNHVERAIVGANARGQILDAGTGTGRFALPLARVPGNSVVALDYSADMLALNRQLGANLGAPAITYVRGDVENLPFRTANFDAVVSITVVRHFPQWKAILAEYVRVLKPGGTIVFEMCSGDHIAAANRFWPRFGAQYRTDGFLSYEAEIPQAELRGWLDEIGVDVVEAKTYDFLNENAFLKLATVGRLGYRIVLKALKTLLTVPSLWRAMARLELGPLGQLSPIWSYNYMIVGRKR